MKHLLAILIGVVLGAIAFGGLYALDRALGFDDPSGPSMGAP